MKQKFPDEHVAGGFGAIALGPMAPTIK